MPRIFSVINTLGSEDRLDIFYFIENFSHSAWKSSSSHLTIYITNWWSFVLGDVNP